MLLRPDFTYCWSAIKIQERLPLIEFDGEPGWYTYRTDTILIQQDRKNKKLFWVYIWTDGDVRDKLRSEFQDMMDLPLFAR